MRVLLTSYGSRGDVQPMAALAAQIQALGAQAVVCAPPDEEFESLLARHEIPFAPAFCSVRQWIAERTKDAGSNLPKLAAEMAQRQYPAVAAAAADGCDAVVATGLMPSLAASQALAETLGAAYFQVTFCPLFLPSPHGKPYAYPGHPHPPGVTDNEALWDFNTQAMNALFGEATNSLRRNLRLPAVDNVRDHLFTDRPLLAADPVLAPWVEPAPLAVRQTGAWILHNERLLSDELAAFLAAGEPPVYVGFGSMPTHDPAEMVRTALVAVRAHGRRIVFAGGWAGLAMEADAPDVLVIGDVNQQALFPQVAAVVHHGGAGTTTAAAMAGAPQVIVPQVVDQPYWAARVAAFGAGAAHEGSIATIESLKAALGVALQPNTREHAKALAARMTLDGAATAARLVLGEDG